MSNWQFFGLVAALMGVASVVGPEHKEGVVGFISLSFAAIAAIAWLL